MCVLDYSKCELEQTEENDNRIDALYGEVKSNERYYDGSVSLRGTKNTRGDIVLEGWSKKHKLEVRLDERMTYGIVIGKRDSSDPIYTQNRIVGGVGKVCVLRKEMCVGGKRLLVGPYFIGLAGDDTCAEGLEEVWCGLGQYYTMAGAVVEAVKLYVKAQNKQLNKGELL